MKKLLCKIFGHKNWTNRKCDDLPTSHGSFSLSVDCEETCGRCGFVRKYLERWD